MLRHPIDLVRPFLVAAVATAWLYPAIAVGGINRWTSLGPDRGEVSDLVSSPESSDVLWAAASRAVYRSTDAGRSWQVQHRFEKTVAQLVVVPGDRVRLLAQVYGGWDPNAIFTSEDGGRTWRELEVGTPLPGRHIVSSSEPFVLFVNDASDPGGAMRSADGGDTWDRLDLPDGGSLVAVHPSDPERFLAWPRDASPLITTDGGSSWRTCGELAEPRSGTVVFLPHRSDTMVVAHAYGPISVSEDLCATWEIRSAPEGNRGGVSVDPRRADALMISGEDGLARSTDLGLSWQQLGPAGVRSSSSVAVLPPDRPSEFFISAYGEDARQGVLFSDDDGVTWQLRMRGMSAQSVSTVAYWAERPGLLFAGLNRAGIVRSTDGGTTWSFLEGSQGLGFCLAVAPSKPDRMYSTRYLEGVVRSDDGGASWLTPGSWPASSEPDTLVVDPRDADLVYGFRRGSSGTWRSTDGGGTWAETGALDTQFLTVDPATEGGLYAGIVGGGVGHSTDYGRSWEPSIAGFETDINPFWYQSIGSYWPVHDLAVDPSDPRILLAETFVGPFRSIDGGQSWQLIREGLKVCCELDGTWYDDPRCPGYDAPTPRADPSVKTPRPPYCEGYPTAVAFDPADGTAYAVTSDGTFRLAAGGDRWTQIIATSVGILEKGLQSIAPGSLIGASFDAGVVHLEVVEISPQSPTPQSDQ